MRSLRAFLVLSAFFALTLPLMPLQLLLRQDGLALCPQLPALVSSASVPDRRHPPQCRGRDRRTSRACCIISNHVSWLDITVLSAVAPVSFVAKQEVASWPFVSWLAKLQRSVFVDRNRRNEVGDKANEILEPARRRRSYRAVRRRNLERRQQRGAVQDRHCSPRPSRWAARRWAPRSRRKPLR